MVFQPEKLYQSTSLNVTGFPQALHTLTKSQRMNTLFFHFLRTKNISTFEKLKVRFLYHSTRDNPRYMDKKRKKLTRHVPYYCEFSVPMSIIN